MPKYRARLLPREMGSVRIPSSDHSVTAAVAIPGALDSDPESTRRSAVVISHDQVFESFSLPRRKVKKLDPRGRVMLSHAGHLPPVVVPATDELCVEMEEAVRQKYGQDLLRFEIVQEIPAARDVRARVAANAAGGEKAAAPAPALAKPADALPPVGTGLPAKPASEGEKANGGSGGKAKTH